MFIKNPIAKWRWDGENGDFIFVFAPLNSRYYLLNPTSATIFSMCDGNNDEEKIVEGISNKFEVEDLKKVEEDVNMMLKQFKNVGIILDEDDVHRITFEKEAIISILDKYCNSLSISPIKTMSCDDVSRQIGKAITFFAAAYVGLGKKSFVTKKDSEKLKIEVKVT
jgi:hypothetical protein